MKKLIAIISAFAAVFLLFAGCQKKDSVTYSGLEAGNIQSGIFTTDNGVEMTVVGNVGKFDVTTSRRVLVEYTTNTGLDANHVEIDVHGLWDALTTPTISASALPEETADSPIQIADAWFNAGYLNVLASFEGKDVSKHQIMTAYSVSSDGITLRLYHDGSLEQTDTVQDISPACRWTRSSPPMSINARPSEKRRFSRLLSSCNGPGTHWMRKVP